jgi:lactoylglutathione lyase
MLAAVWHASFHVSDLDRSVDFYTRLLGMDLVHRQDQDNDYTRSLVGYPDAVLRVAQLAVPGRPAGVSTHDLELVEYVVPRGTRQDPARHHPGAAHLAFAVTDIAAEYERLCAEGVRFVSPPNAITAGVNAGGAACYFTDPDECTLELVQPPPHRMHLLHGPAATAHEAVPAGRQVALHSVLAPGQENAYESEHAHIPEEMVEALREAGVRDWSIWRSGRDLFHLVDVPDLAAALDALATDPRDQRWQAHMAGYVQHFVPADTPLTRAQLRLVWTLSGQVATGAGDVQ